MESLIPKFDLEKNVINPHVIFPNGDNPLKVYYEETDSKNYTSIHVPLKRHHRQELINAVKNQLLYFDKIRFLIDKEDGTRVRKDGRTRCIFENGTESNILKRSVEKNLYANGKVVTENLDSISEEFIEHFSDITDDDKEAGYIYVLQSESKKEEIAAIKNLYKIGYSTTPVEERIKNAENEVTYLMASVKIESSWKCYNMNAQKFEKLIHKFFGSSCLEVDVFDKKGKRHTPREWFIVPLEAIEQVVALIITDKVLEYEYDVENQIVKRK